MHPPVQTSHDTTTETSPLLSNGKDVPDSGTVERGNTEFANAADDDDDVPIAEESSTAKLLLVMSSIWLGCFLAALDSTIIATLSAPISVSFNSLSLLSWLASAYLIANAALQPLADVSRIFYREEQVSSSPMSFLPLVISSVVLLKKNGL